jgi:hypothetical protein
MKLKSLGSAAVIALTLAGTTALSVQPADAWCGRFGRCGWRGGWGWGPGAVAAGIVAGAAVGTAAAVAGRPYGPGPYGYYGRPGGYYACPPGYHWGPGGRACYAN